jgi:hypothetical protein
LGISEREETSKDGRINIEIDYYVSEERFFMFMDPLVEVTEYFTSSDAIA